MPGFYIGNGQRHAPAVEGDRQFAIDGPLGEWLAVERAADQHGTRLFLIEELEKIRSFQAARIQERVIAIFTGGEA